ALRFDVFHQAAPVNRKGLAPVVELTDGDSHSDSPPVTAKGRSIAWIVPRPPAPYCFRRVGVSLEWAVSREAPECESTHFTENLETCMIGVALAQWLVEDAPGSSSDQHLANRFGNTLGGQPEQLEQLAGRSG